MTLHRAVSDQVKYDLRCQAVRASTQRSGRSLDADVCVHRNPGEGHRSLDGKRIFAQRPVAGCAGGPIIKMVYRPWRNCSWLGQVSGASRSDLRTASCPFRGRFWETFQTRTGGTSQSLCTNRPREPRGRYAPKPGESADRRPKCAVHRLFAASGATAGKIRKLNLRQENPSRRSRESGRGRPHFCGLAPLRRRSCGKRP